MAKIPARGLRRAAPAQGVTPTLGAMTAPAEALKSLAEAGLAGMEEVSNFLQQQQEVVNRRELSEARLAMDGTLAEVQQEMAANPNAPGVWMGIAEGRFKQLEERLREREVSPVVRRKVEEDLAVFKGRGMLRVARDSFQRNLEMTRDAVRGELEGQIEAGNYEGALRTLDEEGEAAGYSPGQVARMRGQLETRAARDEWERRILLDPQEVQDELEEASFEVPGLSVDDVDGLYRRARSEAAQRARSEARSLNERLESGELTRKELEEALAQSTALDDLQKRAFLQAWEDRQPVTPAERMAYQDALDDALEAYQSGEMSREEYVQEHAEIEAELHMLGPRPGAGALRSLAYRRDLSAMGGGEGVAEAGGAVAGKAAGGVSRQRMEQLARMRATGDKEGELELLLRERLENRMAAYAKANPGATLEEMEKNLDRWQVEEQRRLMLEGDVSSEEQRAEMFKRWREENAGPGAMQGGGANRDLVGFVKQLEGFTPTAKWDVRQFSVGYGTKGKKGERISQGEAEKRLGEELGFHRARVVQAAKDGGYLLAPHEIDALTSFDFNCGKVRQLLVENGKRTRAKIGEMMGHYLTDEEKYKKGVARRRAQEVRLFLGGYAEE